jgi:hypothetical protein
MMSTDRPRTVEQTGAAAGSVLRGVFPHNRGVRLRVLDEQTRGNGGPVVGDVVLLDGGDNKHRSVLVQFLNRVTDAATILAAVRRVTPGCVNVANKNILVQEPREGDAASVPNGTG